MSLVKELKADNLCIKIYDTREALGENAAREVALKIAELLRQKSEVNIVFASAVSQNEFLEALLRERVDWDKINAFHLDEYIKLDKDAPQGFGNFLKTRLFSKVNCKSVNYMDGNAVDIAGECERYSKLLRKYPLDVACLGIGENGHLAFNDPPVADFNDHEAVKAIRLADEVCRQQQVNDGSFDDVSKVPLGALTMTIPAITAAKYIFGLVPGKTKAEAVYRTVFDPVGTQCPSTIIRKHENAVIFTDVESAGKLLV